MITVTDKELGAVTGGDAAAQQWANYLSTQVSPVLNGLMRGSSENDRSILNKVYEALQATVVSGTGAADAVINLWTTYNMVYRPSLQSSKTQVTLDQTLYGAKRYVDSHQ